MVIETKRLILYPLKEKEILNLINDLATFEKELKVKYDGEQLDTFFKKILFTQYEKIKENPNDYLFNTFFMIIRKSDRVIVGSIDYKNVDKQNSQTEIGYGLNEKYQGNGYMTEIVNKLVEFAFSHLGLIKVVAETEVDNNKSQKVLERCNFNKTHIDNTQWWEKRK